MELESYEKNYNVSYDRAPAFVKPRLVVGRTRHELESRNATSRCVVGVAGRVLEVRDVFDWRKSWSCDGHSPLAVIRATLAASGADRFMTWCLIRSLRSDRGNFTIHRGDTHDIGRNETFECACTPWTVIWAQKLDQ